MPIQIRGSFATSALNSSVNVQTEIGKQILKVTDHDDLFIQQVFKAILQLSRFLCIVKSLLFFVQRT